MVAINFVLISLINVEDSGLVEYDCQYNETNVMHILLNLLRIKGLYFFRALLAHPQEALRNGTWYTACALSVGFNQGWSVTGVCDTS
jgi:hypothetical protein